MKMQLIMVLDDGETFSGLDGCMIVAVPESEDIEGIEETLAAIKEFDHAPSDDSEGLVVTRFGNPWPA